MLADHGVRLLATAPATGNGKTLTLPIAGGILDPADEKGEVVHEGTLVFQRGARRVPLREIVLKTKHEPLIAKVGGGQLKLAATPKLSFARRGFGSVLSARGLHLTAKLATRLSKKLRLPGVFENGQPLGSLRSTPHPRTVSILGIGRATIVPDPAFVAKLDDLFISMNPIAPAERSAGPLFTFPIGSGGALSPDATFGTLRSGGAVEFLQLGAGQIFWQELWFDVGTGTALAEVNLQPSPPYPGKLGQVPVLDLKLAAAIIAPDPAARTIAVSGASLALTGQTAAYFNQAFAAGKSIFAAGEAFGSASFTAQTQ